MECVTECIFLLSAFNDVYYGVYNWISSFVLFINLDENRTGALI